MHRVANRVAVIATTALLVAAAGAGCKRGGASGGAKDIAASVNGKEITLVEVDRVISQQTGGQQAQLSPLELGARRLQVLDDLIKQEVLFQRAQREKLLPSDDEITQVINEQKQQSGITSDVYQRMLKETGQTEEGLREVARKQLAIRKLLERVDGKIDAPTDKEVEDFYNANRERYVSARGVGLAAIYADPQDNGATNDAKSDSEAQNKINIIYQRLKGGGDFATVAREQSEDPNTVSRGGEIGFFSEDELKRAGFPPELIAKFFGNEMQIGDSTPPTRGSDGRWSIWKLTSRRLQSENLTLDRPEVRKDAADNIIDTRKQLVNAALLEVAMREAKIENKLAESMLNSANSLSSLRPAGAAKPAAPASSPAANSSPAASASPAAPATTPASSQTPRPANANNANAARPAANANAAATPARAANSNR
ncbi:MAG TPA: SurA N-terminal domain-containing protein [Pyrinomonadaceae bacterium]|nr:SurA N-terminal domain-containing protein [Pyrinomonadaceae bacterium]